MVRTAILAFAVFAAFAVADEPSTRPASPYPLTTCIMSGDDLPTDGSVVIEQIDGREVRFCCSPCVKDFKKDPEANHKKLDEKIVEATKAAYPLKECLVSGEALGSMGDPVMYVHRPTNQLVEFCCKSCIKTFKEKPAEYLPKLDAAAAK